MTEKIASTDLSGLAGSLAAEVSQRVRRATDRLAAQRLVLIGQIEAEGSWRVETMHSFSSWLACSEGLSTALAKRTVAAARALRDHLPATAAAAVAGEITSEHVSLMVKATVTETLCEVLATPVTSDTPAGPVCTGEQMLLRHAGAFKVDEFAKLIKSFTVVSDPQAQEKAFKDAVEREFLQISPTLGGMQISGFVTTEHGQAFNAALRAVAGVPAADDLRPADLRKVDSLVDLAHLVLDGGVAGKGANVRPHLSVMITWEEFKRLYDHSTGDHASNGEADDTSSVVNGTSTCSGTTASTCSGHPGTGTATAAPAETTGPAQEQSLAEAIAASQASGHWGPGPVVTPTW
ncbi:DUF222 domain-containing protein, partial [Sanguibacter gelidistatuariae]|uniref:DUF222 domain-containing protein n=1 Tax=Sanguibacter gelidistatuariae TaxID=1814289 RepID=UPI001C318073